MAVGLIYMLVWEGLLANFVSGIGMLSVQQYSLSVAYALAKPGDEMPTTVSLQVAIPCSSSSSSPLPASRSTGSALTASLANERYLNQ